MRRALIAGFAVASAAAVLTGTTSGAMNRQVGVSKTSRATVTVRSSAYGRVLFDARGRALYLFTADRNAKTRCYGACAAAWPPFLTRGRPRARKGARASLLGTTRRRDGSRQV